MDFAAAKKLQESGFTDEQVEALSLVLKSDLATKEDIKSLEFKMKELELKLTVRMGIIAAGQVAVIAALVKLL